MADLGSLERELLAVGQGENGGDLVDFVIEHEYRPTRDAPGRAGVDTQEHEEIGVHIDD